VTYPVERALRRILVALDASRASEDALAAAATLADRLGAELTGLFVEDVNLLRLAGLPFVRQIRLSAGGWHPLEPGTLEGELRAMAARAREALERAAGPHRITWSFRVARGGVSVEVLAAAGEADLLVLGTAGHRLTGGPGETALTAAARAPTSVLVMGRGTRVGRPLLVGHDGSPGSDSAMALGQLLEAAVGDMTVLVAAPTRERADEIAAGLRARLGREGLRVAWVGGAGLQELLESAVPGALLVVGAGSDILQGDPERLLTEARCPVLLAR